MGWELVLRVGPRGRGGRGWVGQLQSMLSFAASSRNGQTGLRKF